MVAIILVLVAAPYLAVALIYLGTRKPGYSHMVHTISELGEIGAPDQRLVAWSVFFPTGLILAVVALLHLPQQPALAALSGAISAGYLVAVLFPCDVGSPLQGSLRQAVHTLGGAIQYVGGGGALLMLAEQWGQPFGLAGILVLAAAAALTFLPAQSLRGIIQRVAELALFASVGWGSWLSIAV